MKTEWDYTHLADAYLKRPNYSDAAVDAMLAVASVNVRRPERVCDVGAGVAHLTIMLASRGLDVTAVEPNDAMRTNGMSRTSSIAGVHWVEGTGERTGQMRDSFDVVTFGSSFNVCDRQLALKETASILKSKGWFACLWNHRQLDDPIQSHIESIIKSAVPEYGYGTRREDQRKTIDASGLFGPVVHLDSDVVHEQNVIECVEAWRSHATLARQAGTKFYGVIDEIQTYLAGLNRPTIHIPYTTNIWMARKIG